MKPMTISEIRALKDETDWERLRNMDDSEIDFSDIPRIGKDFWREAWLRIPIPKTAVSIRLDPKVLAWFRRQGPGYQTRIQAVLRHYVEMAERATTRDRRSEAKAVKESGRAKRKSSNVVKAAKQVPGKAAAKPRKKPRAAAASAR